MWNLTGCTHHMAMDISSSCHTPHSYDLLTGRLRHVRAESLSRSYVCLAVLLLRREPVADFLSTNHDWGVYSKIWILSDFYHVQRIPQATHTGY